MEQFPNFGSYEIIHKVSHTKKKHNQNTPARTNLSEHRESNGGTFFDGHLSSTAVHPQKLVGTAVWLEEGSQEVWLPSLGEKEL